MSSTQIWIFVIGRAAWELSGGDGPPTELLLSLLLDYYSIEMFTQIRLIVNGVVVDAALCLWHFLTCIS